MNKSYLLVLILLLSNSSFSENNELFKLFTFGIMTWLVIVYILKNRLINFISFIKEYKIFSLLILLFCISFIRTNNYEVGVYYGIQKSYKLLCFVFLSFVFSEDSISKYYDLKQKKINTNGLIKELIKYPLYFLLLNLGLTMLDIDPLDNIKKGWNIGESLIASNLLGVSFQRKNFALTDGINGLGVFVGGLLTVSLFTLFREKVVLNRLYYIIIVAVCIISLIFLDTRSALLWSFVTNLIIFFLLKLRSKFTIQTLLILSAILPVILVLLSSSILTNANLSFISRGDNDLATGNSRMYIWLSSLKEISTFKFIHLFGYGEYGQTGSKVSLNFGDIFSEAQNADLLSTHNLFFQTTLDMGYLGLFVLLLFVFQTVKQLLDLTYISNSTMFGVFIAFNLYFFFSGGTEATLSNNLSYHLWWFFSTATFSFLRFLKTNRLKHID